MKEVINAALRSGLEQVLNPPTAKPYRTTPRPMGLRQGFSYDDIAELLARAEGEDHRYNCRLCSTDGDFARFPDLDWVNPISD
jgi:hypothetical protein